MKKIFLFVVFFICAQLVVSAQEVQSDFVEANESKDWGYSITPYALLAAQSTDVGGERIRQSFNDLSSITNAGFQIISTLRYKRMSLSFDGTFATLGVVESNGGLEVDATIKQNILDFKYSYLVYNNFEYEEENVLHGWSIDIGVGAKYWKNDVHVDASLSWQDQVLFDETILTENQEWWDLMVGTKMKFIITQKFLLSVAYNVGGFGISNSSKFSHDFTYINSFQVHKNVLINAGFRAFRYRRVDGAGASELETIVNVLGPLLGVSLVL